MIILIALSPFASSLWPPSIMQLAHFVLHQSSFISMSLFPNLFFVLLDCWFILKLIRRPFFWIFWQYVSPLHQIYLWLVPHVEFVIARETFLLKAFFLRIFSRVFHSKPDCKLRFPKLCYLRPPLMLVTPSPTFLISKTMTFTTSYTLALLVCSFLSNSPCSRWLSSP